MAVLNENIKKARAASDKTLEDVAAIVGVSRQTIQKYESGVISNIPSDKVELLAKALNTTPAYLMGWETEPLDNIWNYENIHPISLKKFPLLGEIACGEPIFADEDRESYILAGSDIRADFCLKAKGDSMINARILDGDIVFIRKQKMVENGEIAAVIINDDATLKRIFYYPEKGMLILKAENPKYEDFIFSGEELNQIKILGKAVAFQSDIT